VLFGQVTVVKLQMRDLGMSQVHGFGLFRVALVNARRWPLNCNRRCAGCGRQRVRSTECSTRMRRSCSDCRNTPATSNLIDYGHAFLGAIGPIKAAFAERAWAADFDEQLADKIASLQRRNMGKQERRSGTAGLELAVRKLARVVRELNAIMKAALRTSDPALLAVWKSASRVYTDPIRKPEESPKPATTSAPPALASTDAMGAPGVGTSAASARTADA
jgi:hypothetical protein